MTAKYIRSTENHLIRILKVDIHNCFHTARLMNIKKCFKAIALNVTPPVFHQSVYSAYVYPLYCYLEYLNNFISLQHFADCSNLHLQNAQDLINVGREVHKQLIQYK